MNLAFYKFETIITNVAIVAVLVSVLIGTGVI
jgi:hypothetical protein